MRTPEELSSYAYTYDLSGLILTEEIRTDDGTKIQSYGYDAAGQLASVVTKDKDGTIIEETTYAYDNAGNKIEIKKNAENLAELMTTKVF